MLGIIANSISILLGATLGLIFHKKVNKDISNNILKVVGVVVFFIGLLGIITSMVSVESGEGELLSHLTVQYELELLIFLVLGMTIGCLLKINQHMVSFSMKIENKIQGEGFAKGFLNSSIVFSIGAMAIIGSINAAVSHDNTLLYTKSLIDMVTAIVLASALGYGVLFSSIAVFVYQSIFYLLGLVLANFFQNIEFLNVFCAVGYAMVSCIGINFIMDNPKKEIKVANMLPALLLIIIYYIFKIYIFG